MNVAKSLGEALHTKRKTQTWLAKELGCTIPYVNEIYLGNKTPSVNKLNKISEILGMKLSEFIALGE
jgi:transcriptional regulator with XRE-family HTH domain